MTYPWLAKLFANLVHKSEQINFQMAPESSLNHNHKLRYAVSLHHVWRETPCSCPTGYWRAAPFGRNKCREFNSTLLKRKEEERKCEKYLSSRLCFVMKCLRKRKKKSEREKKIEDETLKPHPHSVFMLSPENFKNKVRNRGDYWAAPFSKIKVRDTCVLRTPRLREF